MSYLQSVTGLARNMGCVAHCVLASSIDRCCCALNVFGTQFNLFAFLHSQFVVLQQGVNEGGLCSAIFLSLNQQ